MLGHENSQIESKYIKSEFTYELNKNKVEQLEDDELIINDKGEDTDWNIMDFVQKVSTDYMQISNKLIRMKFRTEIEIEKWVTELMIASKVTWSIRRTIRTPPNKAKKHTFKRIYHCHFNTNYRSSPGPRKKKRASRNIMCPAVLTIILVYFPKNKSRSKTPDVLAKDWPCIIQFSGEHNHNIFSATALTRRPIGESTKQEILEYFGRGRSVSSAYHSFRLKKMEEWGDKYNTLSADRYYFPNKTDFQNLWVKYFKRNYGEKTDSDMFAELEKNLTDNKVSFKICHIDDHYAISLCTSMMKRAATLSIQASEILSVDATSNCDLLNHKIYFFTTQFSIPLGCIISTSQKEELFDMAVQNLIDVQLNNISPKIILTDDDMTARNVLQKHWPESNMLLCSFHVLKAVWKWLNIARNNIPKEDRPNHYKLFKNVLYSQTKEELDMNIRTLQSDCKFENYNKYIHQKLEDIQSWSLYHRKHLLTRGSDTNNTLEVMFRLFKVLPLERTKAYNLSQLADFITSDFESYYKQRLLDLCFGTVTKNTIDRFYPNAKDVSFSQIKHIKDTEFCVLNSEMENKYFVDLSIGICSCPVGFSGKICKHQSCIILNLQVNNVLNTLTNENKTLFFKIATGSEPSKELLMPLKIVDKKLCQEESIIPATEILRESQQSITQENNDKVMHYNTTISDEVEIPNNNILAIESIWTDFIKNLNEKVITALRNDPLGFTPAIQSCITSYQNNVNSSSSLLSSLNTLFQSNEQRYISKRLSTNTTRKGKKIGIQPTSVARRKTVITCRRKLQAGRQTERLIKKKRKAVHSL